MIGLIDLLLFRCAIEQSSFLPRASPITDTHVFYSCIPFSLLHIIGYILICISVLLYSPRITSSNLYQISSFSFSYTLSSKYIHRSLLSRVKLTLAVKIVK